MRHARLDLIIARQTSYFVKDMLAGAAVVSGVMVGLLGLLS